jgi:hypothetical protein
MLKLKNIPPAGRQLLLAVESGTSFNWRRSFRGQRSFLGADSLKCGIVFQAGRFSGVFSIFAVFSPFSLFSALHLT